MLRQPDLKPTSGKLFAGLHEGKLIENNVRESNPFQNNVHCHPLKLFLFNRFARLDNFQSSLCGGYLESVVFPDFDWHHLWCWVGLRVSCIEKHPKHL